MNPYEDIRQIARRQAEAVTAGDFERVVSLLEHRGALLANAPAARPADADAIRETLTLDEVLAGVLKRRSSSLRDELTSARHGRTALAAYRPGSRAQHLGFDVLR